eukprot:m51a1_g73 putative proteasome subunit beta type-6 (217) ;mRNA; f:236375-237385
MEATLFPGYNSEHMMGTTIMALEYKDGVVLAADSRTTTGSYIANRVTNKITRVSDRIFCCRSGSAADTQTVNDYVSYYIQMHSLEVGEEPRTKTAAALFQRLCYENKKYLLAGIICAGWDEKDGGTVYNIPLGGSLVRQPLCIGGSGSTYIFGYCDAHFRMGMDKEEALAFARNAVALAMSRDGSSGGVIRTLVINKDGLERAMVPGDRLPHFWEN